MSKKQKMKDIALMLGDMSPAEIAELAIAASKKMRGVPDHHFATSRILDVMGLHMAASIAGANPPTITRSRGLASISRTSAGIYVMTMSEALDIAGGDGLIIGAVNGTTAVGATFQASPTTASTVTVTLATLTAVPAAAAADLSYWIAVLALGPN